MLFRLICSLFKYILWFCAAILLLNYTKDRGLIEQAAMVVAAMVIIDAVFLLVETVYSAVRSTKRAGARAKKRAHERSIARAEKRGEKRGAKKARSGETEPTLRDKLNQLIELPKSDGQR